MRHHSLAAIGAIFPDGKKGFYVLDSSTTNGGGHAEDLLDPRCGDCSEVAEMGKKIDALFRQLPLGISQYSDPRIGSCSECSSGSGTLTLWASILSSGRVLFNRDIAVRSWPARARGAD